MNKTIHFTAILFFLCANIFAQAPDTVWTRVMGFPGHEYFTSVKPTTDGGFIIGGFTESFFNDTSSYWLVRLNSEGETIWSKVFKAEGKYQGQRVLQTPDGGFVIAGDGSPWIIKTDADGNLAWQQPFSTIGGSNDDGRVLDIANTDGGFIAAGNIESEIRRVLVIKTNSDGNVVWKRTFGADHDAIGFSITETNDGGIAVVGYKQHPTGGGEMACY